MGASSGVNRHAEDCGNGAQQRMVLPGIAKRVAAARNPTMSDVSIAVMSTAMSIPSADKRSRLLGFSHGDCELAIGFAEERTRRPRKRSQNLSWAATLRLRRRVQWTRLGVEPGDSGTAAPVGRGPRQAGMRRTLAASCWHQPSRTVWFSAPSRCAACDPVEQFCSSGHSSVQRL